MRHYKIYFQASRTINDREQYRLRYKGREISGSNLREGIDKLSQLLIDEEIVDIKRK